MSFRLPFIRTGSARFTANQDASAYNRNQDSHAIENIVRWYDYWRERPGTGSRVSSGGVNIIFSDTNTHFRGAENYRRSGEVDALENSQGRLFCSSGNVGRLGRCRAASHPYHRSLELRGEYEEERLRCIKRRNCRTLRQRQIAGFG